MNDSNDTGAFVYSGGPIDTVEVFKEAIRLSKTYVIGCVSAVHMNNVSSIEDRKAINSDNTEKLSVKIATSFYDYFESVGRWVNPEDGSESEETIFIVIGPEYDSLGVGKFHERMLRWCRDYHQWAVLIIEKVNDSDTAEEQLRESHLEAYYYDAGGSVVKKYTNASPNHIGLFFSDLAKHNGAIGFSLTPATYLRNRYIRTSPRSEYVIARSTFEERAQMVHEQREYSLYKRFLNSAYHRIFDPIKQSGVLPGFSDLFDHIDTIVLVDDINADYCHLGIDSSNILYGEDYESYTKRELYRLSDDELNEIRTVGAIKKLFEMHEAGYHYSLSPDQIGILQSEDGKFEEYRVTVSDIRHVLTMIDGLDYMHIPSERTGNPYKSFAKLHDLYMTGTDYLNILKDVRVTECVTQFDGIKRNSGIEVFEFVHPVNGYSLKCPQKTESQQSITDEMKISVKISINSKTDLVLALVSFHTVGTDDTEASAKQSFCEDNELNELVDSVVEIVNKKCVQVHDQHRILNQFRYDYIHYEKDEMTIGFVDSFDEEFDITVNISFPLTNENRTYYEKLIVEKLMSEWDTKDRFYRENYIQNE